jgi:hypothetical protein
MATPRKENPQPGGRPTTYDPAYCEQLIEHMSQGYSFMASCGLLGFCKPTGYGWSLKHPEFATAIKIGHAKRSAFLESRGIRADSGPAVTYAVAALKNCNPDEFRDNQRVELGGIDGDAIKAVTRIELVAPGNDDDQA